MKNLNCASMWSPLTHPAILWNESWICFGCRNTAQPSFEWQPFSDALVPGACEGREAFDGTIPLGSLPVLLCPLV